MSCGIWLLLLFWVECVFLFEILVEVILILLVFCILVGLYGWCIGEEDLDDNDDKDDEDEGSGGSEGGLKLLFKNELKLKLDIVLWVIFVL